MPIVLGVLAALLLMDASAASAKGSGLFLRRRVYVPGETAVALLAVWLRPSVADWVVVMGPDPLWFAKASNPTGAAARVSMRERHDGERYVSWVVPSLPFGRYELQLCSSPCGPAARRLDIETTMLVADDRSDALLMRRIERLLVRRVEVRTDTQHKIMSLRGSANMLRATRATAHSMADHEAEIADELSARLSAMEARSEAQRGYVVARLIAAFSLGASTALAAGILLGRRSRRTSRATGSLGIPGTPRPG